jgi:predicted MFS family arabinose efflux permease
MKNGRPRENVLKDDRSEEPQGVAEWNTGRRNYVLFILCIVAIFNYIDRQIITILLQPIKEEFGASDTAMGLLTGLIFAGCYAVMSVPLARLSDRYARRSVLAVCLVGWSLLTSLGGVAQAFWQLALTRVGVAAAESGAVPASHAMISDLYPLRSRGRAIAVLSSAQSIGIGLGVLLGGWLSQAFSWRLSFFIVGLPGLVLAALLMLTVKDPPRGMSDQRADTAPTPSFVETVRHLWALPTYRCAVLTVALGGFTGYGLLGWGPTFLIRVHHMSPTQVGLAFGLAVAVSLICGNMLGGWLCDWLGRRDLRAYFWLAGAGPLLSIPFMLLFVFAPDGRIAVAGLFLGMLLLTLHIPTSYTMGQTLAPLRMRATASVFMGLASVLVGSGISPFVIGAMNDALTARYGPDAIRHSLAFVSLMAAVTAVVAMLGVRWVRQDYARAHGEPGVGG